jgi:hypothetical protein
MDQTIAGGTADAATLTYKDDITLVTKGYFEFHIPYIGQFLDKVIHHGFTLNLDKSLLLETSIKLLGHTSFARAFRPHLPTCPRWRTFSISAW